MPNRAKYMLGEGGIPGDGGGDEGNSASFGLIPIGLPRLQSTSVSRNATINTASVLTKCENHKKQQHQNRYLEASHFGGIRILFGYFRCTWLPLALYGEISGG